MFRAKYSTAMLNAVTNASAGKTPGVNNPRNVKNIAVTVVINIAELNAISVLYFFSERKEIKNVEIKINSPKGIPKVCGYFNKSTIELISVMLYVLLRRLLFQILQRL